jgi:hypothetical protein
MNEMTHLPVGEDVEKINGFVCLAPPDQSMECFLTAVMPWSVWICLLKESSCSLLEWLMRTILCYVNNIVYIICLCKALTVLLDVVMVMLSPVRHLLPFNYFPL